MLGESSGLAGNITGVDNDMAKSLQKLRTKLDYQATARTFFGQKRLMAPREAMKEESQ